MADNGGGYSLVIALSIVVVCLLIFYKPREVKVAIEQEPYANAGHDGTYAEQFCIDPSLDRVKANVSQFSNTLQRRMGMESAGGSTPAQSSFTTNPLYGSYDNVAAMYAPRNIPRAEGYIARVPLTKEEYIARVPLTKEGYVMLRPASLAPAKVYKTQNMDGW